MLARDVVASIRRFASRISFADALMAATEELSAPDDSTVRFRLKRPFPHLPEAPAGPGGIVPAIMPERLAVTSPFKVVDEIIGSGPYHFMPEEHISGARAAYQRFTLYQPRTGGPLGFTSGPKIAHLNTTEQSRLSLETLKPACIGPPTAVATLLGGTPGKKKTFPKHVFPHSPRPASTTISLAERRIREMMREQRATAGLALWRAAPRPRPVIGLFAIDGSSIVTGTSYSAANDGNNYSATVSAN